MEHWKPIWSTLEQRRQMGENYPLRILIMGPSDDGSIEYEIRCMIKEELSKRGHGAVFSEEISNQDGAWTEELIEEVAIQALEAHVIIMIYCSRGTQSEREMLISNILGNSILACKSIVFVEETLHETIKKSLTGQDWEAMARVAEVHVYEMPKQPGEIIEKVIAKTQKLRRQVYVRELLRGGVF